MVIAIVLTVVIMLVLMLFMIVAGIARDMESTKKNIEYLTTDMANMGNSMQKCLDQVTEQINKHAEGLNRHQQAIEYLTKECDD